MVAGGTEFPISRIGMAGFIACRALSTSFNDTPHSPPALMIGIVTVSSSAREQESWCLKPMSTPKSAAQRSTPS